MIAFTRPRAMSPPEWPPRAPDSSTSRTSRTSGTGERSSRSRVNVCQLPAHPMVIALSLVPSRLRSSRPATSDASRFLAPSSPCSSDTVKSSSSGPCATSVSSATASAAATPMPLSAPRVVPFATTQSPSTTTSSRPSRGSYGLSGSRSHTMSRCAWRTTVGPRSRPAELGTCTTTLPSSSTADSKRRSAAQRRTCSRASASCFGGRAISVSSEKRAQTPAGSRPVNALISATSKRRPRRGARFRRGAASSPRFAPRQTSRFDR